MPEKERRAREETSAGDGDEGRGEREQGGVGGAGETIAQELKQAVRDAALEVLGPAARQATSSAARYAVENGPNLVSKNVMPALTKAGGAGGLAGQAMSKGGEMLSGSGGIGRLLGGVMSKLGGGRGGGAATGWGHNRRMPVQQFVYCSVPIRDAYTGWTEYKQWPRYMHRANQADAQINEKEARVKVTEKMWGFKRPFTAEVVTQHPDEHIKWNSTEGVKHTGVINFHELGPRLTLIETNVDVAPSGPLEKIARGA
ncbi:MAG TPA: SRPBCC family protein, partial [Thermoanaerobaculia bacterium]|nr:SRPBCC family protein [Thermoanaerobaculia bacterium]